ncbi:MAG: hypothetical protein ACU841_08910 [Gammaproteobacteria bacterium]
MTSEKISSHMSGVLDDLALGFGRNRSIRLSSRIMSGETVDNSADPGLLEWRNPRLKAVVHDVAAGMQTMQRLTRSIDIDHPRDVCVMTIEPARAEPLDS